MYDVNDKSVRKEGATSTITDGLLGLGDEEASLATQLRNHNVIERNILAMCLTDTSGDENGAGFVSIGEPWSEYMNVMVWTKMILLDEVYVVLKIVLSFQSPFIHCPIIELTYV